MTAFSQMRLLNILFVVEHALKEIEDGYTLVEDTGIPPSVDGMGARHGRTMQNLTTKLKGGRISQDQFNSGAEESIRSSFEGAYRVGRRKDLDAGDKEWLRRATEAEVGYARNFGQDILEGRGTMPYSKRAAMYGATVDSTYWNGWVESAPRGSRFDWVLGVAEHCDDCRLLAVNSPYSKNNLPTTPRSGSTICKSNCRCRLRAKKGRLSASEREGEAEYEWRKKVSLFEMIDQGKPPKGMRLATSLESLVINRLRNKINYNRRLIAQPKVNAAKKAQAIKARKAANEELIDFVEDNDIYETPLWSVDEVVDGSHIGLKAEGDIFRSGIDGDSFDLLGKKQAESLVSSYEKRVGDKFWELDQFAKPKIKKEEAGDEEEADSPEIEKGDNEWQILAEDMHDTFLIAAYALLAARGTGVQVGPFNDQLLEFTHVWVKGKEDEAAETMERLDAILKKKKIEYIATPVRLARVREHAGIKVQ